MTAGNPYRPGMGTVPLYLADREGQLRRFGECLRDFPGLPHNLRVTGLRGVGKTVLLGEYAQRAHESGWLTVGHECEDTEADGVTALRHLRRLIAESVNRLSPGKRRLTAIMDAINRTRELAGSLTLTYGDLGIEMGEAIEPGYRDLEERVSTAWDLLAAVAERSRAAGIVFLLDEFQVWCDRPARNEFPVLLLVRSIARLQRRREGAHPIMLVLGGLDSLVDHLADAQSYTERMFDAEVLGNLSVAAAKQAFVRPAEMVGTTVEDPLADLIAEVSGGYPYFLQFIGARLWRAAGAGGALTVRLWNEQRDAIHRELDATFFVPRYTRATAAERYVLQAVAAEGETITVERLLARTALTHNQLQPRVAKLVAKGLVYRPERGRISFTTPLFGDFLRRVRD